MDKISDLLRNRVEAGAARERHAAIVIYGSQDERELLLDESRDVPKTAVRTAIGENLSRQTEVLASYGDAADPQLISEQPAIPAVSMDVSRGDLRTLQNDDNVQGVIADVKVEGARPVSLLGDDPTQAELNAGETWALETLSIQNLWSTTTGSGITVGVIDSGVHDEHPVLAGKVRSFAVVDPQLREITNARPFFDSDVSGHGTHVCGTIVGGQDPNGVSIGVAPEARLRVVVNMGGYLRHAFAAVSTLARQGVRVMSMSWGFDYFEPQLELVFSRLLHQLDIVPVAAIGNSGWGTFSSPGNLPSVLGVGALERRGGSTRRVADFSGGASIELPGSPPTNLVKPDIVAPGKDIYSAVPYTSQQPPQYRRMNGTSMATPHVAGVAALLRSAKPRRSAHRVVEAIKSTATRPVSVSGPPDNRWGIGIVDPPAALNAL